jgi:TolB-like protein
MRKTIAILLAGIAAAFAILIPSVTTAQTQPSESTVLVMPFSAPADSSAWIGMAVQQDLLTDVTQAVNARVLAPANLAPAADPAAALKAGHDAGASFVIFGQSQSTSKEVRLTGAVLDVSTGKPLAALKATGPSDQLFHLEDALAGQVFAAMPRTLLKTPIQPNQTPSPTGVYVAPPVQDYTDYSTPTDTYPAYTNNYYQTPDYGSYYPDYTYAYPDWSPWPYWGTGVVVLGNGFHHHFHDFDNFNRERGRDFGSSRGGSPLDTHDLARGGESHFAPLRSGVSTGGIARQGFAARATPHISSGAIRGGGGFHAASSGGFHGFSGGGFHGGGGGGFHGGGGGRGGGGHR